ncbi:hypothetical protein [Pseudonocardia alni]|uniref:hypothetical protein n=1 Tax=Pseudonocardia alni TaxID=33907 RepID=UPI00280A5D1E|nr:hypothetical protein [Pseudonocardia alni]
MLFSGAPVPGALSPGAESAAAGLLGALFPGALLPGAESTAAGLLGTLFPGELLAGAESAEAGLLGALFPGALPPGAESTAAGLLGALLPGTLLPGALLPGALLPGAESTVAGLLGTLFPGALLAGALLPGAPLPDAPPPDATSTVAGLLGTLFPGALLPGAPLPDAPPPDATSTVAGLLGTLFPGALLPGVLLASALLPDAPLPDATSTVAGLLGALLPGALPPDASRPPAAPPPVSPLVSPLPGTGVPSGIDTVVESPDTGVTEEAGGSETGSGRAPAAEPHVGPDGVPDDPPVGAAGTDSGVDVELTVGDDGMTSGGRLSGPPCPGDRDGADESPSSPLVVAGSSPDGRVPGAGPTPSDVVGIRRTSPGPAEVIQGGGVAEGPSPSFFMWSSRDVRLTTGNVLAARPKSPPGRLRIPPSAPIAPKNGLESSPNTALMTAPDAGAVMICAPA